MIKKLVTIIVAAGLAISTAGSSFAAFGDLELIRVVYERTTGTTEQLTDMGAVSSFLTGTRTVPGDAFTANNADNLFVCYFAIDKTTNANQLWVSGSTDTTKAPVAVGSNGFNSTKSGSTSIFTYYNSIPFNGWPQGPDTNGVLTGQQSNINSFKTKYDASQGALANGINIATRVNTEISLASLINGTATSVTQDLYYFDNKINTGGTIGFPVATITTNADGSTTISATVTASNQTISFGAVPSIVVGGSGIVSATATSGLAVSFSSTTPTTCTVSGPTVTGVGAGICTIAADQAGNSAFNAAPQVQQNINIGKGSQTITFGGAPTVVVAGTGAVSATATSGLAVVDFSSTTPAVCTVSGSTVTGVSSGTCTIAANQAGDTNYNAASPATQDITVGKSSQTINFGAAPTVVVAGTGTVSATATSGLAVVDFSSTTPAVCTVNGSTVTGVSAGICTIAANQAGNAAFDAAAQATQDIIVGKGSQTITFGAAPTVVVAGTGTVSATATSGLAVVDFSSTTPAVCTVSGSTVTGVSAGTCAIIANQVGNANYNAASPVTQNITVGKGGQTITFGAVPAVVVAGTGTVSATATSGLAVVDFSSTTPGVCTVSGSTVTGVSAGTCTIAANQAGNANYNAASPVTQNITVGKGSQTIPAITFTPNSVNVGGTTTASATASSGLAVTFSSTTPAVCAVSGVNGTTITINSSGTCTIAADQTGNVNYNAANQITQSITAGLSGQTITFTNPGAQTFGTTLTLSATASSGLTPTFTSSTPVVCAITGNGAMTFISSGTCTINADQAGNAGFNTAPRVTQSFTVNKAGQNITFANPGVQTFGTTPTLSATATSGLTPTFTSSTPGVCTIAGTGELTSVTTGTCSIAADQAGNTTYIAASQVTQSFNIGKGNQNIGSTTFSPANLTVGGTSTANATATSGLTITFSSTTPAVCTVSGSTVMGTSTGTCTIAADQAGNANYNAAPRTTQNITIGIGSQTISTITFNPANLAVNGTTTASATATSGLAVNFSSTTPAVCTINGSTITGVSAGNCTITANQAGNANYIAAPQITQSIAVGMTSQTIGTITLNPANLAAGGITTASATATSGLAVTFSSITPAVCTVNGSIVTGVTAGACTIAADQAGNTTYNSAAQVTQNITVGKSSQTISSITFNTAALKVGGTTTANATATSGLAVTLSSATPDICTVNGSTVTGVSAGTCTITADQAGNANYNAASRITQNITAIIPPITFTVFPTNGVKGGIDPATNQTVEAGKTTSFTVNPDQGFQIATVTGCGGTLSGNIYTTAPIIRDCTVSAAFIAIPTNKGDLNNDGKVDIADALLALKMAVGLIPQTSKDIAAGDVAPFANGKSTSDGKIDIADAVAILQKSIGLLNW